MSQTEVQLIKDAVIVNADVSNSAAIDVSKISGAMPLAGGTFTGDILFQSDSGNILFDKSDNALEFSDNNKAKFGGSGDLEIYHSGTHSIIKDAGTGNLQIAGSLVQITNAAISASMLVANEGGSVELNHNGTKKFETTSSGVSVAGNVSATTFSSINLSASVNQIKWPQDASATNSRNFNIIGEQGSYGVLDIKYSNARDENPNEKSARFIANGGVELYHNNVKKIETTADGVTVNGVTVSTGNIQINNDTGKIRLGASQDFEIYHDGGHSTILDNGTGNIKIYSNGDGVDIQKSNGENMALFKTDDAVELYFDNTRKLKTNSVGVQIGTTSARFLLDSLTSGDGSQDIGRVGLNRDNGSTSDRQIWNQYTVAPTVSKFNIFARTANDTGTAGNYLEVDSVNNLFNLPRDNEKLQIGASQDLQLYHDGTSSVIKNATGDLYVQSIADVKLRTNDSELAVDCTVNDSVALYYDTAKKFETTSLGAKTFGRLNQVSADNNTSFRRDVYYLAIGTQSTKTITLSSLNGTGVFRAGGYTNAGQGALGLHILFGGAMFATQHYQVNELINSGMQNTSISTSKNSTNYTIQITNSSTTFSLILQIYLESTGTIMGYAVS